MPAAVFVIDPENDNRGWIASALASTDYALEFLGDGAGLFARPPSGQPACLVTFAEPDADAALQLVREVRRSFPDLPVIVLGPHSAFRTAVDIARLPATDFLELPVSGRQLRVAIGKALKALPDMDQ
jgi:FixJ family two-component response regulator